MAKLLGNAGYAGVNNGYEDEAEYKTVTVQASNTSGAVQQAVLFDQSGLAGVQSGLSNEVGDLLVDGSSDQYSAIVDWLSGTRRLNIRRMRLMVVSGSTPKQQLGMNPVAWRGTPWDSASKVAMKIIRGQWPGNNQNDIVVFNTNFWVDNATLIAWKILANHTVDISLEFPFSD